MKLHLPFSLRKALLACLAAFALPVSLPVTIGTGALISFLTAQQAGATFSLTTELTDYDGITYSGKIYTISGNTAFHTATFTQLKAVNGSDVIRSAHVGTDLYNDEDGSTPSFKFWENVWGLADGSGGAATAPGSRYGQTLRFADSANTITYEVSFTPLRLGGIITEEGNSGDYILSGSSTGTRNIYLESRTDSVNFTLKSNLQIKNLHASVQTATFRSSGDWRLASGKTLTWGNYNVETNAGKSIVVSRLDNVAAEGDVAANVTLGNNLTIGNGGTLTINDGIIFTLSGTLNSATTTVHGGDLIIGSFTTNNFITVDGGGSLTFTNGITLGSTHHITINEGSSLTINGEATISSTSALTLGRNTKLTIGGTATINSGVSLVASDEESSIVFNGSGNSISGTLTARRGGSITFNGSTTVGTNGTLSYDNGGSITFNGAATILSPKQIALATNTKLTFNAGATLGSGAHILLTTGELNISGVLDATNATLSYRSGAAITVNTTKGGQLKVGSQTFNRTGGTTGLNIILEGAAFDTGWNYQLFTVDSYVDKEHIIFDTSNFVRGIELELGDDGVVRLYGSQEAGNITWQGTGAGITWANGTNGWVTEDNDKRFHPTDSVTFEGADTVTISDAVTVGNMSVLGTYSFNGGAITVQSEEGLYIDTNADASFNGVTITTPKVVAEGQLTLDETNITAENGLHLMSGANVSINGAGLKKFADMASAPGVTIDENATLHVGNMSNWQGYVQGEGTLEFATGGLKDGQLLFRDSKDVNSLTDEQAGKLLRGAELARVRLVNDTLLQITSSNTPQPGRLNKIKEIEVTKGSVFAWRAPAAIGDESTQLILAGEGELSDNTTTYKGALQIGVFLANPNTSSTYTLNSKLALADSAAVYVHGVQKAKLTNLYTSNGHTLKKLGEGELNFSGTFRTEGTKHGRIEVQEGTLTFDYTTEDALAGQDVFIYSSSSSYSTLVLGGSAQATGYTIGALSGGGRVTKGDGVTGMELRFTNSYKEKTVDNTFSGEYDADIIMNVMGGYQAFERRIEGELTMLASGGTLDLEGLTLAEGEGNALHLTAGTPAGKDAKGTAGTLKLNGYFLPVSATLDATLYSGSLLEMSHATINGGADNNTPDFSLDATASKADLSGLKAGVENGGALLTFSLKEGSTLNMVDSAVGNNVELQISASASVANLSRLSAGDHLLITTPGEADEEGNELPGLTNGSSLNISNSTLGNNAVVTVTAEQSSFSLSGTSMGENSTIDLTLTNGASADLSHLDMAVKCYLTLVAMDSDTSLSGAMFDVIPPDIDDENPVTGGVLRLDVTGGTHDFSNISFGKDVSMDLIIRNDAWVKLDHTTPATGLKVMVYGTTSVIEGLEVGMGSRVNAMDGVLTLAGNNIIHLDPELDKMENSILSDMQLNLLEGAKLRIDATSILPDVLAEIGKELTYYIADGDLTGWRDKLSFGAELALLNVNVSLGEDGSITFRALEVAPDTVYIASRDNTKNGDWNYEGDIYASTDEKVAVYLDRETTINLRGKSMGLKEDGLVLKNLYGAEGANLYVQGDGSGKSMITLNNNFSDVSITEMEDAINRGNTAENRVKLDHEHFTTFNGNMTIEGADMQIRHRDGDTGLASASATSLINGVLTMTDGKLMMTSGRLELAADGNDLGRVGITFAGHDGQLVVRGDTTIGGELAVVGSGVLTDVEREEHILLSQPEVTLSLADGTRINSGVMIGNQFKEAETELPAESDRLIVDELTPDEDEDGELLQPEETPRVPMLAGTVSAQAGAQEMEVGSKLSNVTLHLEAGSVLTIVGSGEQDEPVDGELVTQAEDNFDLTEDEEEGELPVAPIAETDWMLAGLTGEGKLASTVEHTGGIEICTAGGDKHFSGDLSEYQGTIVVVAGNDTQFFDGVKGGKGWNLVNSKGGRVEFNLMAGSAPNSLTMGALNLKAGSFTTILFDMEDSSGKNFLNLTSLNIEDTADVTLGQFEGTISLKGEDGSKVNLLLGKINVENADQSTIGSGVIWHLRGIRNASVDKVYVKEDGNLYADVDIDNTNAYAAYARSENAAVGAGLMWGIQNTYTLGGDLAAIDALLYELLVDKSSPSEADIAKANHAMAAVAGASTAVLSSAVSTDMERQLRAIRNRTTALAYSGDSYSRLNSGVWINAESNYHKQNADGTMPGYKLNGWGGTVGAHTQVSPTATVGVALTAMYNDLESVGGADMLKGDMDTYYLSGFAQVAHDAWRHTFVMSVSKSALDATRTVNYGEGSYTTKDSTDGLAFGLLYEVGYTMPLNIDYSVCLQPVFNLAWRVGQIGAYTETGATNAGLHVEEQTFNAITFGAGARVQAAFGSRLWNRTGLLEGRALLKADVGDRQGESSVSLQNAGNFRGKVKAAEMGAVGVELGAGVTVPTGRRGEVFADFSAELRADYTNLNAAVGYRINF